MFGPHTSPVSATERETQSVVLGFSILHYSVLLKFLIKKVFPRKKFKEGKKIIWSLTLSLTNHFFFSLNFPKNFFPTKFLKNVICFDFYIWSLIGCCFLFFKAAARFVKTCKARSKNYFSLSLSYNL